MPEDPAVRERRMAEGAVWVRNVVLDAQIERRLSIPELVSILCTIVISMQDGAAWDHLVRQRDELRRLTPKRIVKRKLQG